MDISEASTLATQSISPSLAPSTEDTAVGEVQDTGQASLTGDSTTPNAVSEQAEEFTTFLTLLTAQIKNQDPLAPLDATQFVDQLATFSNLELQAEGNNTLEEIASLLANQVYGASVTKS